jgi:hypothetical protein
MATRKRRRSALETFDGCPHRYNVLYRTCRCGFTWDQHAEAHPDGGHILVAGLCDHFQPVEDRGDESQRGIAFHEAAFRYIDRLAKANVDEDGRPKGGMVADAHEASLAFREGMALAQVPPHLVGEVGQLWQRFTETFELDLDAYLMAEERQEDERFTWVPDLVYVRPQGVEIPDWKTYYRGLTQAQAEQEFQAKFYLLRAKDVWPGFSTYSFRFVFVRLSYSVTVTKTPDQIEQWRDEVEGILLSIQEAERTGNFPAIPGSHCTLCRLQCPIATPQKLPSRVTTRTEAEQAFGQLLVREQEVKALKKALNGWCSIEGPLVYRGQEYAHRASDLVTFRLGDVWEHLTDGQERIIEISRSALKPIWKKPKDLPADLAIRAIHETRWQFRHRKAGEEKPAGSVDVLATDDNGDED